MVKNRLILGVDIVRQRRQFISVNVNDLFLNLLELIEYFGFTISPLYIISTFASYGTFNIQQSHNVNINHMNDAKSMIKMVN